MEDAALRATLGLVLVVAIILVMAWLMRRSGFAPRQAGGVNLRLVSRLSLGPRQNVVVVQTQDTWLILGQTTANITLLHTMPAQTAPESQEPAAADFSQALAAKIGKMLKRP